MRTDPSDNGGLFVGRRPGTAPTRFRALPKRGGDLRQRFDGSLAGTLLAAMILLSLLCWGPIPLACLWIGSQADYLSGSISFGILVSFIGLFVFLFGALVDPASPRQAWILVRRAAGHDQRTGRSGGSSRPPSARSSPWFSSSTDPGSRPRDQRSQASAHERPIIAARTRDRGPARLLPPVRRDVRGGGQRRACASRPPSASARRSPAWRRSTSRRPPGPSCPTRASSSDHVRRPARPAPLSAPARLGAAQRARRAPRRRARPADPRQRRRRAAQRRHARADRARPAAAHLLALLPAVSDHGPPRPRPRRARDAAASTRCWRRRRARHARGRARQPQRPDRRAAAQRPSSSGCSTGCPRASPCCSTSRSSSSPTRSHRLLAALLEDHPRLLVFRSFSKAWGLAGLRIGYALGAPARRSCWPSSRPTSASPRSPRRGAWRRCAAARSCSRAARRA
jgi:hypothetical protein